MEFPADQWHKSAVMNKRNPEQTQASILVSATQEFARYGFDGARVDRIVRQAKCNPRMLYHYFGSKQALYIAVLEDVYRRIRGEERALELTTTDPREGLLRLTRFTWEHFHAQRVFVDITRYENLARGKYIRQSETIATMSSPIIGQLGRILDRGIETDVFRHPVDALQLYISIVALSAHHLNNAHTLSATFDTDLSAPDWLAERRIHMEQMVLRMVGASPVEEPPRRLYGK